MFEPILANYTPQGADWAVEVTGAGKTLKATAPGLIAARDRADQLVAEIAPGAQPRTVVHMLEGDAVGFTAAYLAARMGKPEAPAEGAQAGEAPPAPAAGRRSTSPA